ncbi:MAG TPA: elongation factor G [Novosphingobium sp.]|nr:elongation factor G [Novosphingobium sp.]
MEAIGAGARAIAIVGPAGAGKTTLMEALLHTAGALKRCGSVEAGTSLGDASPEARSRGSSTELNIARLSWGGDCYALLDCPGAVGLAAEGDCALAVADLALVVVPPEPERAVLAEPLLRQLAERGIPHLIFVNRIDKARGDSGTSVSALIDALQPLSAAPLVARQMPIIRGGTVTGYVDLALDRAFLFREGGPAAPIPLDDYLRAEEQPARSHFLEQLADHDDNLLERLLNDEEPELALIANDLAAETARGEIVPVLFGSATHGFGLRRLLKALRHDTPAPAVTAERLGIAGAAVEMFKVLGESQVGRLAIGRVFGGRVSDGAELRAPEGKALRAALFAVQGSGASRLTEAGPGEIIALAKAEGVGAGMRIGIGAATAAADRRERRVAHHAVAIAVPDHADEVRLSGALARLVEEDLGLAWETPAETRETLLRGLDEDHVALALERLRRRHGLKLVTRSPTLPLRETIRKPATQRGRHKKQSGGHGQFGDVLIELRPLGRGEGFVFEDRISGGVVPRQWIPAVEQGIRDAMARGPLGFPVVDVAVALVDGSYHSVDSSELAFRTAGRLAMSAALAAAAPYLLEPVAEVEIHAPPGGASRITSALASRRARVLGMTHREGWHQWETIAALVPEAELHRLQADLRAASQGLATFTARFDHLAEVAGKAADQLIERAREAA